MLSTKKCTCFTVLLLGFLFISVESGSLIQYFTVDGQSQEVSAAVNDQLTFKAQKVEGVSNPRWEIIGRNKDTRLIFGGLVVYATTISINRTATCAYNDIFDCTATLGGQTETLSVRVNVYNCSAETPEQAPTVSVYNTRVFDGQTVQLKAYHSKVDITWEVEGGEASVTNVTLECGSLGQTTNGSRGTYRASYTSFTSSQSRRRCRCVCTANHVTGVSKTTTFYLKRDPTPEIVKFTANGERSLLKVSKNQPIKFVCSVVDYLYDADCTLKAVTSGTILNSGPCFRTHKGFVTDIPAVGGCRVSEKYECTATRRGLLSDSKTLQVDIVCNTGNTGVLSVAWNVLLTFLVLCRVVMV
ncbi:uncharacterized protein LOC131948912 isoform X2 [Physella acuta]|nr:uncharacterized protein LOC131948912 isoform X2 [Physella acuta]XP_059166617.1 uncharacterized protein LOC131948912 isoform X2 [Physella acuta]XP_059166618.1 uncharacterized protein LOC131948912 isoform X2 [Physella acuta]XP_059166620.1 uncharacterized protein LOC131948912 isoform X2 [Physella acuta]XP_059166621.1 uncharacterized protein LOC131948912 isoform X2 [Physella acuta]XP_059166622.1 uncharacterized protein LOC131948912 isoform X2 [Physella acuta]XP_059166623.1 uncharacterized prot